MKIRNCFVSNSSSSSFVLIGTIVAEGSDVVNIDLDRYKNKALMGVGGQLSDGLDIFDLTDAHIDVIKKKIKKDPDFFDEITFYEVAFFSNDYSSDTITKDDLKDDNVYEVLYGYVDYHSSDDASKLIENVEYYDK